MENLEYVIESVNHLKAERPQIIEHLAVISHPSKALEKANIKDAENISTTVRMLFDALNNIPKIKIEIDSQKGGHRKSKSRRTRKNNIRH